VTRKLLNYIILAAVIAPATYLTVSHSRHMRFLVDSIAEARPNRAEAAAELIRREQFIDSFNGEPVASRLNAAVALEQLGSADAAGQLDAMLKDPDKPVRERALNALVKIGPRSDEHIDKIVAGLKEGDSNQRNGSVAALGRIGRADSAAALKIIPKVCQIMKKEAGARTSAGDVLGGLPDVQQSSIDALIPYLSDFDEAVHVASVEALGKVGSPAAIPVLLNEMKKTPQVRRVAIGAIAVIGDPSGEAALTEALKNPNEDNEVRAQAATGMGRIGTPTAAALLIGLLDDYDLKVQLAAVAALARIADSAVPGLIHSLKSAKTSVRIRVVQTLGEIRSPAANHALIDLITDKDLGVRLNAIRALGFSGNSSVAPSLQPLLRDPDSKISEATADALARIGDSARTYLIAALKNPDASGYFAARALSAQGDAAVPDLQSAASRRPSSIKWAVVALRGIGTARSADALKKIGGPPAVQ